MDSKYPILVVRIILKNLEDNILFLKRAGKIRNNRWSLPGGKVEKGQTLEMACKDELKQETNLDIFNLKFLFYREDMPVVEDPNHCIIFYFIAEHSGNLRLNKESSDSRWMSLDDLSNYDIAFGHDSIVRDYRILL